MHEGTQQDHHVSAHVGPRRLDATPVSFAARLPDPTVLSPVAINPRSLSWNRIAIDFAGPRRGQPLHYQARSFGEPSTLCAATNEEGLTSKEWTRVLVKPWWKGTELCVRFR
jgi:hypothetical protein